jgi:hypothetical protein
LNRFNALHPIPQKPFAEPSSACVGAAFCLIQGSLLRSLFTAVPTSRTNLAAFGRPAEDGEPTIIIIQRTSAMRGGDTPSGEPYLQRLVGIRIFSLLFSKTNPKPTLRAATVFRSAGRDLRNKLSLQHAERSACRAITRGSGGEQPTHIYCIPTSAVWFGDPPRGTITTTALLADPNFFPIDWTIQNRPGSRGH